LPRGPLRDGLKKRFLVFSVRVENQSSEGEFVMVSRFDGTRGARLSLSIEVNAASMASGALGGVRRWVRSYCEEVRNERWRPEERGRLPRPVPVRPWIDHQAALIASLFITLRVTSCLRSIWLLRARSCTSSTPAPKRAPARIIAMNGDLRNATRGAQATELLTLLPGHCRRATLMSRR